MKQTVGKKKQDFSVKSLPKTNIMALNQKILEIKKWVIFSGLRCNIDKLKTQPPQISKCCFCSQGTIVFSQ